MKIGIVSCWNKKYEVLANLVLPNRRIYCEKHGYESVEVGGWDSDTWEGRAACWGRMDVSRKVLHRFDAIFVMDIDAVITNMDIKIEDLATHDFVSTADVNGLNAGMILIKHTDWSAAFMDKYWETGKRYQHFPNSEQSCMAHLLICEPQEKWSIKPQRTMNSFPYHLYEDFKFPEGQWESLDFILHTPALDIQTRLKVLGEAILVD
jgi:hypothetical protein